METNFLIGTGIGTILFLIVAFLLMCYFVWSNPLREGGPLFFAKAKQNTTMHIMVGNTFSGKRIFLSRNQAILPNGDLHQVGEIVDYNGEKIKITKHRQKNILGMVWIGFPGIHSIHFRKQQWMEWESKEEGRKIKYRDEETPFLLTTPFEYAMLLANVEDQGNVKMNFWFTVTTEPSNVDTPIFGADDAYGQLQTACLGRALPFVRENNMSTIGREKKIDNVINNKFSLLITKLNDEIPERIDGIGTQKALGYKILSATIVDVEILDKDLREISTLVYKAEQNAKAKVIEGEGIRDFEIKISEGEAAHFSVKEKFYKNIAGIPGAMNAEKLGKVPNLTTYVEGENQKSIVLPIK